MDPTMQAIFQTVVAGLLLAVGGGLVKAVSLMARLATQVDHLREQVAADRLANAAAQTRAEERHEELRRRVSAWQTATPIRGTALPPGWEGP